ncbi:MAG: 2-amino-4-hydroxy-6-hydroxymethyldihydropteridine diphosphokinase [Elusimicrobiota bacterium]
MHEIYLSLGSNLGYRDKNIIAAVQALSNTRGISILKQSSVYETSPVGKVLLQPAFLNIVIKISSLHAPQRLLKLCQAIEVRLGRLRSQHWGPRMIDIDILFYDNLQVEDENLIIPHPGAVSRRFVLVPLGEIEPQFVHPITGKDINELLQIPDKTQKVVKYGVENT